MKDNKNIKYNYEYFTIIMLAEGVFAAIEKDGLTGSNAGIIDLGSYTIIFDTFLNIDAARELKKAGEELTGKNAVFVINSHSHTDHIIGNCIFPDETLIISSKKVRELIVESRKEFAAEKGQYASKIEEIEISMNTTKSSSELGDMLNELKFLRNLVKPGVDFRVPDLTIEKETVLHGNKRTVVLIPYDTAHSSGDLVAYLPDDKICFMGDLLFSESHPWIGSGNPEQLMNVLYELSDYEIEQIVPGHGRLSSKDDIFLQIQYINEIIQMVNMKKSININDYTIEGLSPVFKSWKSLCFQWNINFLIERMKDELENRIIDVN